MIRLLFLLPIMVGLAASYVHHVEEVGYTYTVPEAPIVEPDWFDEALLRRLIESLLRDPHQCTAKGL